MLSGQTQEVERLNCPTRVTLPDLPSIPEHAFRRVPTGIDGYCDLHGDRCLPASPAAPTIEARAAACGLGRKRAGAAYDYFCDAIAVHIFMLTDPCTIQYGLVINVSITQPYRHSHQACRIQQARDAAVLARQVRVARPSHGVING